MEVQAGNDGTQHVCVVCGAPAAVWCHHDEASLCRSCDAEVHSSGPLAWMHKRTPLYCCQSGEVCVAAGCGNEGGMPAQDGAHEVRLTFLRRVTERQLSVCCKELQLRSDLP